MKNLIIYGVGAQAEMAYSYFGTDSDFRIIAFTIEQSYLKASTFLNLPLLPFEEIENYFHPDEADMFIAIGPIKLGSVLENNCSLAKSKGYRLVSYYPSSTKKHFIPDYGENCFFDPGSLFHSFVKVGRGTKINNSQVGHHTEIGDFCFLSSAIIGGKVIIEDCVFLGMRATIKEGVRIGKGSIIGMGALITRDVEPYSVYSVAGTKPREDVKSYDIELFKKR
jgi:sugar O-acyltransferase (sialic acid O-acetyltransferase NeuD family)